jgi:hypothetical protein
MKIIITENQFEKLKSSEDPKILHIPSFEIFDNDWDKLQKYLDRKGNPPYSVGGNLNLRHTPIESLGNLTSVGGRLDLGNTPIKSLGNLTSVGGDLNLYKSSIESLGNLTSVGGSLDLEDTPISNKHISQGIKRMVNIKGDIYL